MSRSTLALVVLVHLGVSAVSLAAEKITAERSKQGVVVKIDGKLFTEYLTRSGTKPILWPIIGPTGKAMTRAWPMEADTKEKQDHVHHRSLWFTHGSVNGIDFWGEPSTKPAPTSGKKSGKASPNKYGTTEHRDFVRVESGPEAVVVTRNDWVGPDGKKQCEDERVLTFGADGASRWIDFAITFKATAGPVTFGDTKEGSFGLRLPETLRVDAKKGGRIVNSRGQVDGDAWGKQAEWVDYYGPVDGQTLGIAILNHPSSFRFPTYWHVRTYGLFAANPFGVKDFAGKSAADGTYTIPSGDSITLRYRVVFHEGDEKAGKIADLFAAYAKPSK
jgi:hypothetical protein